MEPSAEKKIKHFVEIRFFPKQDPEYLYNILSTNFLKTQLPLANNIFRSLENQTNKNFEIVFLMNPAFLKDQKKYKFVFETLKSSTTLPLTFAKGMASLLKNAMEEYDFVIQTRMDFDDFVYKDAVADTQSKVDECDNILAYGYCRGYSYLDGELLPYYLTFKGIGHHSIFQSLIMKSSFAKNMTVLGVYLGGHNRMKVALKASLAKRGIKLSENMFQQNTSAKAFVYYRHEFARYTFDKNRMNPSVISQLENKLTSKDITKKQLEEEFGFNLELNSIE